MIKNYFKTAWRSLWKNKTFSAIKHFWFIGWCRGIFTNNKLPAV
jgi:hypothetical protein